MLEEDGKRKAGEQGRGLYVGQSVFASRRIFSIMESPAQTLVSARNPDTLHKAAIKSYCGCFFVFFWMMLQGYFYLNCLADMRTNSMTLWKNFTRITCSMKEKKSNGSRQICPFYL